ncbi:hypothetical protein INR49_019105 [Caranx melampygus]|nr:hypothetical protein INR49_019105 [Caranx melampygus]
MKTLTLFLLLCHSSSAVKHSLKFFSTVSDGVTNLPEFVVVALLDDIQGGHCDSNTNTVQVKQTWMQQALDENPEHLQWYNGHCFENTPNFFKASIQSLKRRFNQSGGVHIFQRLGGCEWDDETIDDGTGFQQYGYNGEDFISLDMKTETWVAPKPQAFVTKLKWDADKSRIKENEDFFTQTCPKWLKTYLKYGRSSVLRTDLPSVSLLQKTPPLQSAATLQVSTLTELWCSGPKMERSFMRTWTKERSSPTMMGPSR